MTSTMINNNNNQDARSSLMANMVADRDGCLFDGDLSDGELTELIFPLFDGSDEAQGLKFTMDGTVIPKNSYNNNNTLNMPSHSISPLDADLPDMTDLWLQANNNHDGDDNNMLVHSMPTDRRYLLINNSSPVHEPMYSDASLPAPITPQDSNNNKVVLALLAPREEHTNTAQKRNVADVDNTTVAPPKTAKRSKVSHHKKKMPGLMEMELPPVVQHHHDAPNPLTTAASTVSLCSSSNDRSSSPHSWSSVMDAAVTSLHPHPQNEVPENTCTKDEKDMSTLEETPPTATVSYTQECTTTTTTNLSTSRILALTGDNGATEFMKAVSIGASAKISTTHAACGRPLTSEERTAQSRSRNKEHARNTRLRKKAYVDELKVVLNQLVAQRDQLSSAQEEHKHMESDQRKVRLQVLEEFLHLRGRNERDSARWNLILEPQFELCVPAMSMGMQTHSGVAQVMEEANQFAATVMSSSSSSMLEYQCEEGLLMDGSDAFVRWTATTSGHGSCFGGSLKARFNPETNKLTSAQLMLDTGAVWAQLNNN